MSNSSFNIPEQEVLLIIDSNTESAPAGFNLAECPEQVGTLIENALKETKRFIANAKIKFSQHLRSISRAVLQNVSSPRLQIKNRSSRSRRSHSASQASSRSANSSDGDSIPSDPLPLHNPSLCLALNLLSLFIPFSMAHTSINEVMK